MRTHVVKPIFFVRAERKEHRLIEQCSQHADGVVLLGRLLAPPWSDEQHPIPGLEDSSLRETAVRSKVNFMVDPDTWPLTEARGHDDRKVGRSVRMAAAREFSLPVRPEDLADDIRRQVFVRASMADQAQAAMPAAPYFRFTSLDDPWLAVNLDCIRTLVSLRGGRPVAAFVMCDLDALASGALAHAARMYASAMPRDSLVFVGVADFHPDEAERQLLVKYLLAVEAWALAGLPPIADRIGEFGPAAVAFGARGASRGTRIYRHTPAKATFTNDFNPIMKLKWLVPATGQRLAKSSAVARLSRRTVRTCPKPGICVSLQLSTDNLHVRLHDAHQHRHELLVAAEQGVEDLASTWRDLKLKRLALWAQALKDAAALSDAA